MSWRRQTPCLSVLLTLLACVPKEGTDGSDSASHQTPSPPTLAPWRPRPGPRPVVTPGGVTDAGPAAAQDPSLVETYTDSFDRKSLGPDWFRTSEGWELRDGRLCGQAARNHPLWLKRRLPVNANISFTARSLSKVGDIKVEAWGAGRSYAHGLSYSDATSYLFVFGGWNNRLHVLARLNEHGEDRKELHLTEGSSEVLQAPVVPNRDYHFVIQRTDGRTISWAVDNTELFLFEDQAPLGGNEHDHFAFNNWESEVCFDNLVIVPLE